MQTLCSSKIATAQEGRPQGQSDRLYLIWSRRTLVANYWWEGTGLHLMDYGSLRAKPISLDPGKPFSEYSVRFILQDT
jgi:hypothetical protein